LIGKNIIINCKICPESALIPYYLFASSHASHCSFYTQK